MHSENMNRKLFLKLTLTSVAGGVLAACSSDDEASNSGPTGGSTTGAPTTTGDATGTTTGGLATSTTGSTATSGTTGSTATSGTTGSTATTGTTGSTATTGTTGSTATTGTTGSTATTGTTGSTATTGTTGSTATTATTTGTNTNGAGGTGNMMSCTTAMLSHVSTTSQFAHDHLGLTSEEQAAFVMAINGDSTGPVTWSGGSPHTHNLTFTADEIMTLLNGGMVMNKVTDEPNADHTHTYNITCA